METIILIIFALAILLFPLRRHFDSAEKIKQLLGSHFLPIRSFYVVLALLWFFLNKKDVMLSQWDAQRIGIPALWYTLVPVFLLLFYAIFPLSKVWTLLVVGLVFGWALHIRETIAFSLAHMNVKTDVMDTIVEVSFYFLLLVLCIGVLYFSGPYAKKRLAK